MDFSKIKENNDFPYKVILDDMQIKSEQTRREFVDAALMFANNCYGAASQQGMNEHEQLQGYYHWRTFEPARFFKIGFTYYHSQELIFAINMVEELTLEQYMQSASNKTEDHIGVYNPNSNIANNVKNSKNN